MGSGAIGLVFCFVGLVAAGISIGIPYWLYVDNLLTSSYSGLWQACGKTADLEKCKFETFGVFGWWDAIRILEAIGGVLGLLGTFLGFLAVCSKKTRNSYVAAGITVLLGGACVAAGFITYAVKRSEFLEHAHAGFYLNIVGCVGLGIGGLILLCTRGEQDPADQSGHVIHSYGQQQPAYHSDVHIGMQRRY